MDFTPETKRWAVIAGSLMAGTMARWALRARERQPFGVIFILADLATLPLLALAASYAAAKLGLENESLAFVTGLFALSSERVLRIVTRRFEAAAARLDVPGVPATEPEPEAPAAPPPPRTRHAIDPRTPLGRTGVVLNRAFPPRRVPDDQADLLRRLDTED